MAHFKRACSARSLEVGGNVIYFAVVTAFPTSFAKLQRTSGKMNFLQSSLILFSLLAVSRSVPFSWQMVTSNSPPPPSRSNAGVVVYNNYLYTFGGEGLEQQPASPNASTIRCKYRLASGHEALSLGMQYAVCMIYDTVVHQSYACKSTPPFILRKVGRSKNLQNVHENFFFHGFLFYN